MTKIPNWMHNKPMNLGTVRDAAAVLMVESRAYGREKNREAARALKSAALRLRDVANGKTWNEAFEFEPSNAAVDDQGRKDG